MDNLPMRRHKEHMLDAIEVAIKGNSTITEETGIKALSILMRLPSIELPISTPVGIMHALYKELEPLMWSIWTGTGMLPKYKGAPAQAEPQPWTISRSNLVAIRRNLTASNSTFPSVFGRPLRNIVKYHGLYKASDRMTWMMILSPVLLAGRLPDAYYLQWARFIQAVYKLTRPFRKDELPYIKAELVVFVRHFEDDYYQYKYKNLRMCRTCIHYLLHLADCALATGVLTHNWEFVIERYVGIIKGKVKSRYQANWNLSLVGLQMEQLNHIQYVCSNPELSIDSKGLSEPIGLIEPPAAIKSVMSAGVTIRVTVLHYTAGSDDLCQNARNTRATNKT